MELIKFLPERLKTAAVAKRQTISRMCQVGNSGSSRRKMFDLLVNREGEKKHKREEPVVSSSVISTFLEERVDDPAGSARPGASVGGSRVAGGGR